MLIEILFIILGLFFTWLSAELIIYASKKIADHFHMSETFVGLTILSIGTSLPEIGTHIAASLKILAGENVSGIAIATNIGSNTVQITAILGLVGFFMLIKAKKVFIKRDYMVMLGAIILLFILSLNHYISRLEGFVLITLYLIYIYYLGRREMFEINDKNHKKRKIITNHILKQGLYLIIGFIALLYTSSIVIDNGEKLAAEWNVSDSLIGIAFIGIGTALPELTTALIALKRKSSGMSLGVLVGSNITNPMFALGIGALISGYSVNNTILWVDIPVWFFLSLLVLFMVYKDRILKKRDSIILLCLYFIYLAIRVFILK